MKILSINGYRPCVSFNSNQADKPKITKNDKPVSQMSEKEKMIAGLWHIPEGEELFKDRNYAHEMCYQYNNLRPSQRPEQYDIIRKLFGKTGARFKILPNLKCEYGYNIEFGERFFANHNLVILDSAKVKFGDDVMIGPNCGFYTVNHSLNADERVTGLQYAKPINVGNRVWICGGVTVVGGVNIGDNVVVGAGSVVTKDLPPNTLCVGNPCRPIRNI